MRHIAGKDELLLYLDYDGAMHHENVLWSNKRGPYLAAPEQYQLFQHAALLEELLAPYPAVKIVLSTAWVRRSDVVKATKRLPPSLQARVIGATFHSKHMLEEEFEKLTRGQQVYQDVLRRKPRDWLALDDDAEGWPPAAAGKFIQTHMYEGISDAPVLAQIKQKLEELCRSGT